MYLPHSYSRNHGVLLGAHSRLVLLWQNNEERDLFCADELMALQVTVFLTTSGDNLGKETQDPPIHTFVHVPARLMHILIPAAQK